MTRAAFGYDRHYPVRAPAMRYSRPYQEGGGRELAAHRLPGGHPYFPCRSERQISQLEREQPLQRGDADQSPRQYMHWFGEIAGTCTDTSRVLGSMVLIRA